MAPEIYHSCVIQHLSNSKVKIYIAESEEAFEFAVQETLKDLSSPKTANTSDLKPEGRAAI